MTSHGEQIVADFLEPMSLIEAWGGIIFSIHPKIKFWISTVFSPGPKSVYKAISKTLG